MPFHDQSASNIFAIALRQPVLHYNYSTPPPPGFLENREFKHINVLLAHLDDFILKPPDGHALWRRDVVSVKIFGRAINLYDAQSFHSQVVDYRLAIGEDEHWPLTHEQFQFLRGNAGSSIHSTPFGFSGDGAPGGFNQYEHLTFTFILHIPKAPTNASEYEQFVVGDENIFSMPPIYLQFKVTNSGDHPWPRHTYFLDSREEYYKAFSDADRQGLTQSSGHYFAPIKIPVSAEPVHPGEEVSVSVPVDIVPDIIPRAAMQWLLTAECSYHFTCDASRFFLDAEIVIDREEL